MTYQVLLTISDVEDALEVAQLLAPLGEVDKVKVGTIAPRPEPKVVLPKTTEAPATLDTPEPTKAMQKLEAEKK